MAISWISSPRKGLPRRSTRSFRKTRARCGKTGGERSWSGSTSSASACRRSSAWWSASRTSARLCKPPELVLHHLAHGVAGQGIEEHDPARVLVAGQAPFEELQHGFLIQGFARDDAGTRRFTPFRVLE